MIIIKKIKKKSNLFLFLSIILYINVAGLFTVQLYRILLVFPLFCNFDDYEFFKLTKSEIGICEHYYF